jgi:hypothetical protein
MNAEIDSGTLLPLFLAGSTQPAKSPDSVVRRRPKSLSEVDTATQLVEKAKRAADASLLRAKAAPKPHEITNPAFIALFEAHQRDKENLFAAMRALDVARSAAEVE